MNKKSTCIATGRMYRKGGELIVASIVTRSELLPIAHFSNHLGIRMPSKQVKGFRILIQILYGDQGGPDSYDK